MAQLILIKTSWHPFNKVEILGNNKKKKTHSKKRNNTKKQSLFGIVEGLEDFNPWNCLGFTKGIIFFKASIKRYVDTYRDHLHVVCI